MKIEEVMGSWVPPLNLNPISPIQANFEEESDLSPPMKKPKLLPFAYDTVQSSTGLSGSSERTVQAPTKPALHTHDTISSWDASSPMAPHWTGRPENFPIQPSGVKQKRSDVLPFSYDTIQPYSASANSVISQDRAVSSAQPDSSNKSALSPATQHLGQLVQEMEGLLQRIKNPPPNETEESLSKWLAFALTNLLKTIQRQKELEEEKQTVAMESTMTEKETRKQLQQRVFKLQDEARETLEKVKAKEKIDNGVTIGMLVTFTLGIVAAFFTGGASLVPAIGAVTAGLSVWKGVNLIEKADLDSKSNQHTKDLYGVREEHGMSEKRLDHYMQDFKDRLEQVTHFSKMEKQILVGMREASRFLFT